MLVSKIFFVEFFHVDFRIPHYEIYTNQFLHNWFFIFFMFWGLLFLPRPKFAGQIFASFLSNSVNFLHDSCAYKNRSHLWLDEANRMKFEILIIQTPY